MLRIVAIGIWVILVTAGATFASVYLKTAAGGAGGAPEDKGTEEVASDMTSVPVIRGGDVVGYVLLQLSFSADRAVLEQKKVDPLPYLKDAAFRVVFGNDGIDFRHVKSGELEKLTVEIAAEANRRLGAGLIRNVLLQQFNYVKKEDIRTNWIGGGNAAE